LKFGGDPTLIALHVKYGFQSSLASPD